ncbi:MAG: hypothetical protein J7556_14835 [Acidovorax sp.]|nr:hypothetical protein [Acidovorax sp.]
MADTDKHAEDGYDDVVHHANVHASLAYVQRKTGFGYQQTERLLELALQRGDLEGGDYSGRKKERYEDDRVAALSDREHFEAHMRSLNACTRFARQSQELGGCYRTVTVQRAWELWQAARCAPQPVAREPLTDEQIESAWNELLKRRATDALKNFDARIGMSCRKCGHGTYQADSNGYNSFHRCDRCQHVPIWCADGTELLAHGITGGNA